MVLLGKRVFGDESGWVEEDFFGLEDGAVEFGQKADERLVLGKTDVELLLRVDKVKMVL